MDAGWAQAWIAGAAILASGVFAVLVPLRERRIEAREANRRRFDADTERFEPSGLTVHIRYRAEFSHVGLSCRAALLEPRAALLQKMRDVVNPAKLAQGGYVMQEADGVFMGGTGITRLARDPSGLLYGSFRILPPADTNDRIDKARMRFEVVTDTDETLFEIELPLSPTPRIAPVIHIANQPFQA